MTEKNSNTKNQPLSEVVVADEISGEEDLSPSAKADVNKEKGKKKRNKPRKEKRPVSKTAVLALLIALLVCGAMGYEYMLLKDQQQFIVNLSKSQNSLEQELKRTRQALETESQARKDSDEKFASFKLAMEALATKLGRTSNEWRLAEVEYLLSIANYRLSLTNDRITAITIFENADLRIKEMGDPTLLKIRKTIKEELVLLKAVEEPDLSGMALSLSGLVSGVERLPLINKERVEVATGQIKDQAPESWKDIPATVWKDIKSLVVVRRHQQATEPLLPPAESWFLVQNLRLKLEQARLSVLRRDTVLFRQYLNEANTWISTFFEEDSPGVINALKETSALAKVELRPAVPDVSGSLRQLRSLLVERGVKIGTK